MSSVQKIIICVLLLSLSIGGIFANEKLLTNDNIFRYKSALDSDTKAKYAGIAQTAVGSTLLSLGVASWGGIIAGQFLTEGQFIFAAYSMAFFLPMIAHAMTLIGSMLTYIGCTFLRCCEEYYYGSLEWKYEMVRLRRNLGIILLGTSVVPLTGLVSSIALMFVPNYNSIIFIWPLIGSILYSLGHIISGTCLLVGYSRKLKNYWSMINPDISLTHDDKKGFNEGYGVSLGVRMRI